LVFSDANYQVELAAVAVPLVTSASKEVRVPSVRARARALLRFIITSQG
jgi:hypothetical protein